MGMGIAALIVAGAGLGGATAAGPVDDVPVASCAGSLVPSRPVRAIPRDVVVGPVTFSRLRNVGARPPRAFRPRLGRDHSAKTPLHVRGDAAVRLEVAPRDRGHVALNWVRGATGDRARGGAAATRFEPCDRPRGSWWPGAFVVDGPRCVHLVVRVEGEAEPRRVRVPFGRGTCRA